MRSLALRVVPVVCALGALTFACSDMAASSFGNDKVDPSAGSDGGKFAADSPGSSGSTPELVPTDNGVIMVHAAGMPAFRLCFENEPNRLPAPDRQTMPDANVVGVEVGSAVRIEPLKGPPGKIYVFDEPLVRELEGQGIKCGDLLTGAVAKYAREMPAVTTDYSKGVHLLVLKGCQGKTLVTYTKGECGQDYDENQPNGNLALLDLELKGAPRPSNGVLPTQVLHLSQALEESRGTSTLAVSFGDVKQTDSQHTSIASGPELFKQPITLQQPPSFDPTNDGIYADVGFRVSLQTGQNAPIVVVQESLANVQHLSAPREIPSTYYAAASNYTLLLLGAPSPKLTDGAADTDPLRNVHLLAVPVIEPKADAGADAEADAAPDGAF